MRNWPFFVLMTLISVISMRTLVAFRIQSQPPEPRLIRYKLHQSKGGVFHILFENAPDFIVPLSDKSHELRAQIAEGEWLVVAYGLASVPDELGLKAALKTAMRHGGSFKLGVRPFWRYEEISAWLPEYQEYSSPVWAYYREGKLLWWHAGGMNEQSLEAKLRQ